MTNEEGSVGTTSLRSPWAFTILLVLVALVLLASTVVMIAAFFMPGPLEEHQRDLLNDFTDGFKVSLAALIGLVAGKITTS